MKTFALLAMKTALSDICDSSEVYPAQTRCWDDCDLNYRDCLREFYCHKDPEYYDSLGWTSVILLGLF